MIVPKINNKDYNSVLARLEPNAIACCNWPAEFPYTPAVSFKCYHDGDRLYLRFDVDEQGTAALVNEDNGAVWTDSCVEFFIAPDEKGYYNFETTCIGKMLLGYHKSRNEAVHAPAEILASVKRDTSLPAGETFAEKAIGPWSLTLSIPATALFKHDIKSWDGVEFKGNFYKCGDNLAVPHFVSWQPIKTEKPDFHRPEFFGPLSFEK